MDPEHALVARPDGPPLVLAHRGDHRFHTENTLAAFRAALDVDADGVELDVRLTADGVVVVVHDPNLFRVAGVTTEVAASTFATLARADLGGDERVPRLDDVLDLVLGADRVVNVEIKGDHGARVALARAVAALLARRGARALRHVVVSTFDPTVVLALRVARCAAPVAFLYDADHTGLGRGVALARLLGVDGVHPHHAIIGERTVARARRQGAFVCAWTVNDGAEARRLAALEVRALITDDVPRIRAALGIGHTA